MKRAVRHKQDTERELSRLKINIADRVNKLSASWASDKVVRTREKFCKSELRGKAAGAKLAGKKEGR